MSEETAGQQNEIGGLDIFESASSRERVFLVALQGAIHNGVVNDSHKIATAAVEAYDKLFPRAT